MKLCNILPQGAGSAIAKAAKTQRTQEIVCKAQLEAAQRAEAQEESLLACIEEYRSKDARKALGLIAVHQRRYPKSVVAEQVEDVRAYLVAVLAERKAHRGTHQVVRVVAQSKQGLPIVDALPAEWSR